MMRVLATSALCLLGVLSIPVSRVLGYGETIQLEIFQPNFKDPYSGRNDTLLDIDLQTGCVSNIQVKVHIPKVSSFENNANFVGPAFNSVKVDGISTHAGPAPGGPATAYVSWDGVSTLTFTNFIDSQVSGPGFKNSSTEPWVNLNFNIPYTEFLLRMVPLTLVLNDDVKQQDPNQKPFINLSNPAHFNATAVNTTDRCIPPTTPPPVITGDPVFAGFQGQVFQFHGLPDEHFNLVSSPDVQLNSHFVYLSSGKCDYTDTECFTHPGTYMDALGLSVADARVKVIAGTHQAGLRVWVNDEELRRGAHMRHLTNNVTTSQLKYHHNGRLQVQTDILNLEIVNSDMFFNIHATLNDHELLSVGATKHTVTDHAICKANTETSNHQLVEQTVTKKYNVITPLHGLIGQTWRNVKVCGRDWMGTVEDYVVSDLFASDNHYNYFNW